MPTYINNTIGRVVDQEIAFDPDQIKSTDKVLVEEIITLINVTGTFVTGETIVGDTSGATGVILRYNSEDHVLDLVMRDTTAFGPIAEPDATPPVTGETITGSDSSATGELSVSKIRLTKTSDMPYFNPITTTEISTSDTDQEVVVVDVDKIKAVIILRHTGSYIVSLNLAANVVSRISESNDEYLVEINGEVQNIILTDDSGATSTAIVLQFVSKEAAYRYFD